MDFFFRRTDPDCNLTGKPQQMGRVGKPPKMGRVGSREFNFLTTNGLI